MKAVLKTDITLSTMMVNFDSTLNGDDCKTHSVHIKGFASHDYIWDKNLQETFEFNFFADKEFCDILDAYLERKLQVFDQEQFPKEF